MFEIISLLFGGGGNKALSLFCWSTTYVQKSDSIITPNYYENLLNQIYYES